MLVSPTIQHVHGRLLSIIGTDPAAGAEISETVPARRRWIVRSIFLSLATDVTVAVRRIRLIIDDGTNTLLEFHLATTQTASLTYYYSFCNIAAQETLVGSRCFAPLPIFSLPAGSRIYTVTSDIKAGDNFGAPQLLVEEWIDP